MSRIRVAALAVIGGLMAASVMVPAQAQPADDGKATNVTAINVDGGLDVSWTPPAWPSWASDVDGVVVMASLDNTVKGTCYGEAYDILDPDIRDNCTIMPLANGYTYQITVCYTWATNSGDPSFCSDPVEGYTHTIDQCVTDPQSSPSCPGYVIAVSVPDAVTNVSGVAGNRQVTVSWSAPANNGGSAITNYSVLSIPGLKTCSTNGELSCTVTGLTNGTAYDFVVTAENAVGPSVGEQSASRTTPVDPCVAHPQSSPSCPGYVPPATVPGAPTITSVLAQEGSVQVSWAKSSDGGSPLTGFKVTATPGAQGCSVASTVFSCLITGLTNGTAYTFTAVASNAVGDSAASAASVPATPYTFPDTPSDVSGVAGDGEATVSWAAPAFDGGSAVTGYTVTASPGGETCSTDGELTCTVSGLDNLVFYTFTVVATNAAGDSDVSDDSDRVVPHSDEFQVWLPNVTVVRDGATQIYVFGAMDVDTVKVRVGREVFEATPDEYGSAILDYNASNSAINVLYGKVRVTAMGVRVVEGVKENLRATTMFFVPKTTVKSRVHPGAQVVVRVRAADPASSFSFRIDGVEVCSADADERGRVACSFDAPEAGDYTVETFVGDLLTDSNDFTVLTGRRPV